LIRGNQVWGKITNGDWQCQAKYIKTIYCLPYQKILNINNHQQLEWRIKMQTGIESYQQPSTFTKKENGPQREHPALEYVGSIIDVESLISVVDEISKGLRSSNSVKIELDPARPAWGYSILIFNYDVSGNPSGVFSCTRWHDALVKGEFCHKEASIQIRAFINDLISHEILR